MVMLTLDRYSHINAYDLGSAVDALPALPVEKQPITLRATGSLRRVKVVFRAVCATWSATDGLAGFAERTQVIKMKTFGEMAEWSNAPVC